MGTFNWLKKSLLRKIAKSLYLFFERLGLHITPNHYYMPIPDSRDLTEAVFRRRTEMHGLEIDELGQLELLDNFVQLYKREYELIPQEKSIDKEGYYSNNPDFGPVDGEILYCMMRYFRPRRFIEIGSGYSTLIALKALEKNRREGFNCKYTIIDPFPRKFLLEILPVSFNLMREKVQETPLAVFNELEQNDILFIDSSHVLKIGGDVQYEYLEVLPRLNKGVLIHLHDIFLPLEYPQDWVRNQFRFWNEQYLLQAFLAFNRDFEVIWAGNLICHKYAEKILQAFPLVNRARIAAGSFWLKKI